jgi:hypothetical protein
MGRRAILAVLAAQALLGCSGDDGGDDGDPALFPADYAATYQQVRNCRASLEHGLVRVRVLASPDAVTPYQGRTAPFPAGAILLKEERPDSDTTCSGAPTNYTVMQKLPAGSSPATLDWTWQEVGTNLRATARGTQGCIGCHTDCGKPPEGYDGTCTVP